MMAQKVGPNVKNTFTIGMNLESFGKNPHTASTSTAKKTHEIANVKRKKKKRGCFRIFCPEPLETDAALLDNPEVSIKKNNRIFALKTYLLRKRRRRGIHIT
jgi:hypothetical protein